MDKVISGYGIISALGDGINQTYKNLIQNKRNAQSVTLFDTDLDYPVFEVDNFSSQISSYNRTINLLLKSLYEALDSAKLKNKTNNLRIGVCLSTTVACQLNDLEFYKNIKNDKNVDYSPINEYLKNNLSEFIKEKFNLEGPSLTVVNACSSSTDAIGTAGFWIDNGLCDIAIAGGADELNLIPLSGFASLGLVSNNLPCPFDKNRSGLNIGEGAGLVIIESSTHAKKRGIQPNIFFSDYTSASDAYHLTAPSPEGKGLKKTLLDILSKNSLNEKDISFINSHGTATVNNDLIEGKIFKEIFGDDLLFYSTKGYTGHTLGAAGSIEAILTLISMQKNWLPYSIGFNEYDEEIGISPTNRNLHINASSAISTSLAFGGNNSILLFQKKD